MRKIFIIILIGLISVYELTAQDYKKNWSEGKLTWEDFTESKSNQGISGLNYFLGYNRDKQKFGKTIVVKYIAKAYIDRKLSWVNPEYKTVQHLRYNQVIFDIVEIHKRRLQIELDRVGSVFEIETKFNAIYNSCTSEIDRFYLESEGGLKQNIITSWEQRTDEELNRYLEASIPEFETRNFGYGLHAGIGVGTFSGSLGKHFNPTFNFIYGFDVAYKKSILYLNGTLTISKVRKEYLSDKNWYKNQAVGLAVIDISYGYAFLDNKNFKLAPFAGLGIIELSAQNKDNKDDGLRFVDYNVIFGVNADYKLRTKIKLTPLSEKVETSIRARLYVARADYAPDLKGYSINLTMGICGFGNLIRLKK